MTRDEILNMPAGLEMDALIARTFFPELPRSIDSEHGIQRTFPFYSKDIAAAWKVAGRFTVVSVLQRGDFWFCDFGQSDDDYVQADTAPLAICRAALLAVMP